MFISGVLGRALMSNDEIIWRRVIGELLLSVIGAIILWSWGITQHLSIAKAIMYGGFGSLGGLRFLQWLLQFFYSTSAKLPEISEIPKDQK